MRMGKFPRHCLRCQAEIPAERAEGLPETRLCVECSRTVGGEFEVTVVPDNLAKTGSLKKNYGFWSIKKKRRKLEPES
jgi:hypothetical protein